MQGWLRVLPALVCSAFAHTVGLLEPGVIHDERIMASEKPFPKKKRCIQAPGRDPLRQEARMYQFEGSFVSLSGRFVRGQSFLAIQLCSQLA